MSLQSFFDNFEQLTEAPNGVGKLREIILQLAVCGKLVPQDPTDNPAAVQLECVSRDRIRLLGQKKIKRLQEIEDPIPDESKIGLPSCWELEWLGNIAQTITKGATPTTYGYAFQPHGIRFIKVENVKNGRIISDSITDFISEEAHESQARSRLEPNDVLFSIAGTIGETCVVTQADLPANINQAWSIIRGTKMAFWPEFLKLQLDSFVANAVRDRARGGAMNNVSLGDLKRLLVYIPPLQEQKRIVAKVKDLMRFCDKLEVRQRAKRVSQARLNAAILAPLNKAASLTPEEFKQSTTRLADNFDTLFDSIDTVTKLRATILQLAIEGKLVAQDRRDQSPVLVLEKIKHQRQQLLKASELKKVEPQRALRQAVLPFALPEGWTWTRLGEISSKLGAGSTPLGGKNVYEREGVKFLRSQNVWNDGLRLTNVAHISEKLHEDMNGTHVEAGDILLNITGASIGRSCVVPENFGKANVSQHVSIVRLVDKGLRFFIHLCITSPYVQGSIMDTQVGISREGLSMKSLKEFLLPIPPLAEQKRIVAKVDQLMLLCDELEAKLRQAEADSEKLMNAAVKHVLDSVRDVSKTTEEVFA